ncbi:beta-lactamase family protein [Streptomyces sp. NBC_00249]|uniref:serine hydrolase domain-containing protein n=1 Tax=Streptomyces sp. NBC_00249 TaxID=2975690 RepID=UPI002252CBFC|nr:serine hydrolase domain-containing protein [Streptomyces sp. NBC_00249]MCX5197028.1 beta-lactamase family protein [Streptomyces sp. NBC_00249]
MSSHGMSKTVMVAVLAAVAVGGLLPSAAQARGTGDVVRQGVERLVSEDRYPAALASTTDRDGRVRDYAAGVGDLRTRAKAPLDGQVRAGSNTKTFTAAVVLQLVGEGKVELDAPVERHLPGLLRGDGIDGRVITVRQLLQHTSGLPNYTESMLDAVLGEQRHTYYQPRTLIDVALAHKARFAPGTGVEYSNTNYVVAGLLVEKITGRPLAEQITRRVIERAGLRHTYFPGVGEEGIRGAHPRGYHAPGPGKPLDDITELDPSWGWAAGQLISTPGDLSRFYGALLGGKVLRPAELAEMRRTVAAPAGAGYQPGTRFGLGLFSVPLSCGGLLWGHGGDTPGYSTKTAATDDGRAAAVAVTANMAPTPEASEHAQALVDTALCRK